MYGSRVVTLDRTVLRVLVSRSGPHLHVFASCTLAVPEECKKSIGEEEIAWQIGIVSYVELI